MPTPPSSTGFKVDLTELIRSGLQLNKFDKGIPFWKQADGIQFTNTGFKRKAGRQFLVDLGAEPIRGIVTVNEFDTKVIYAGDLSNLYSLRLGEITAKTVGTGYNLIETAGASTWDTGSSVWDSGNSVWDEGANEASTWSFTNFGTWVLAANDTGPIQIKKGNITFNNLLENEVSGAFVNTGGALHAVDDDITFTGGSGTDLAATVTEVLGGAVTAFEITNYGSGYLNGETLTQSTTTGSGTGLTIDLTVPDIQLTKVRMLAKSGPHILAFNYTKNGENLPFDFSWCSEDNPDEWIASSVNSAGSLTIREAKTELKCVVPLGDALAVYTQDQLFFVNYVGAPFYFGYRPVMSSGVGAVSTHSVVSVNRLNYGLSRRGFFVTDGSSVTTLGVDEGINDYLKENLSQSEYPQVFGYHNKRDNEVVWALPINNASTNEEIYYNYENGTFGRRVTDLSSYNEVSVFDNPISGDQNGNLYYEGTGTSAQSTTATTRAHDLEDADVLKEVTSIRVGKEGVGSPLIEVGWSDTINGTPVYTDSFTVNTTFKEEFLRTSGRYIFLRVSSSSPSDTWKITHMEIQGRTSGTR